MMELYSIRVCVIVCRRISDLSVDCDDRGAEASNIYSCRAEQMLFVESAHKIRQESSNETQTRKHIHNIHKSSKTKYQL